ncbi:MAG: hypothetical protein GXP46_00620 [Deferribacteres bacterium]|nr:hypothetical protein [Deferribacteres bacterium]
MRRTDLLRTQRYCINILFVFVFLILVFSAAPLPAVTGDLDGDCDVDLNDLNILLLDRNNPVSESSCGEACDLDGDGIITALDSRKLVLLCTKPRCEILDSVCEQPAVCTDGDTRPCSTACGEGVETCVNGQWGTCDAPRPEREVCDGLDNDCNGQTDEGFDADGDGVADCFDNCPGTPAGEIVDSNGCSASQLNRPPAIITTSLPPARIDQLYQVKIEAVDPDNDSLLFTLSAGPDGMTMDPAQGVISWRPQASQIGDWNIEVMVDDGRGGTDSRQYQISVPDTIPPSIFLNVPSTSFPGASFMATATARDNIGVSRVSIMVEGQAPFEFTSEPYQAGVTLSSVLPAGSTVKVTARAVDTSGNSAETASIITIAGVPDTTPPSVKLNAPPTVTPGTTVQLSAVVDDDSGVSEVTFFVDGEPVGTVPATEPVIEYQVPPDLPTGSTPEITVQATDFSGNTSEDQDTPTVTDVPDTSPPEVVMSVPDTVEEDGSINILPRITEDGSVAKIEVYVDHRLVETITEVPPGGIDIPVPEHLSPGMDALVEVVVTDGSGNETTEEKMINIEAPGKGVLTGEVYNDRTGLPIQDAEVTILSPDGEIITTTTNEQGKYTATVRTGEVSLSIKKKGYTEVVRTGVKVEENSAAGVFDARLTPLNPAERVSSVIGRDISVPFNLFTAGYIPVLHGKGIDPESISPSNINLQIPGGALNNDTGIILTQVSPQGLKGLLPPGWSPLCVVDIGPERAAFSNPAKLTVPNILGFTADSGLVLAVYDREKGIWISAGNVQTDNTSISGEIPSTGQYAFLIPDIVPERPPVPAPGTEIRGVTLSALPPDIKATLSPDPKIIFYSPGVRSEVGLTVTPDTTPLSSGIPVETVISEEYSFYSGSKVRLSPYSEDIVLYSFTRFPLTASYPVTPSLEFEPLSLEKGIITVDVTSPAGPGLTVIGPEGGKVLLPSGEELEIPKGAFSGFVPVNMEVLTIDDIGIPLPGGVKFIGGFNIDLTGNIPSLPLTLSIPAPQGITDGQFLLLRMTEVMGATRYALSGVGRMQGDRIVTINELTDNITVRFPGIDREGRYVLVKTTQDVGFSGGRVFGVTGDPISDSLVTADTTSIVSLSQSDGNYASVIPVGVFNLTAVNIVTMDRASEGGEIRGTGDLLSLDISLREEPPYVVSVEPADGAENIPLETSITINFSEPIDPSAATPENLLLTGPEGAVSGSIELREGNTRAIFRPAEPLNPDTLYTFTVSTGIRDLAGYTLETPYVFTFTSLDTTPPPPPPAGNINATIPGDDGKTTVTGTQGSAGVHDTVRIINKTRGISIPVLVNPDGSFTATIEAGLTDEILISITDPAGNETVVPVGGFRNPDGSVVGPEGGQIELENGVIIDIREGTFPEGAVVKATAKYESDIPVSPGPDFPFVAGFEIESSVYPRKYFNVSAPLPSGTNPDARWGIVAKLVDLYGGEPHLAVVDSAKVSNGRLVTSSPPCPGVIGYHRKIYAMYVAVAERMINSFVNISFSIAGRLAFTRPTTLPWYSILLSAALDVQSILGEMEDLINTAIELYEKGYGKYPFISAISGANPYACMIIPPEAEFKAVIRNPETREVIDYIDIDPIEPFGHASFDLTAYKKGDIYGPELAGIEPVGRILDSGDNRITLRFSEPIDHMYLLGAGEKDIYLTLKDNESVYFTGRWELKEDNTVLVFEPHNQLPLGKKFILHLENIRDLSGNTYEGTNIELQTFRPKIIFPSGENHVDPLTIAGDLGVELDRIPQQPLLFFDLDYSTRSSMESYDGRWHTDIVAIPLTGDYGVYKIFKFDVSDPMNPYAVSAHQAHSRYEPYRVRLLDDVLIPPRPDFQGEPYWKDRILVYNTEDPSIRICWDPQSGSREIYDRWTQSHCDPSCETVTGGCMDLAVTAGYLGSPTGAAYSILYPFDVQDSDEMRWVGWRYLSDSGWGEYIRGDVPAGSGYPRGLFLVPHMDISHGGKVHSDTVGAFVANKKTGLQLIDLGLNMPAIGDDERKDQTKPWASVERLHMIRGSDYVDVTLVPSRLNEDNSRTSPRIVAVTDTPPGGILEIFTPDLAGGGPTGSKTLSRKPVKLAVATGIPATDYESGEVTYHDIAVITVSRDTGGGLLIYEIPEDGSSPSEGRYIQMPVGTGPVDVDSRAQLAYVGAYGLNENTGGDGLLIVDISEPFTYTGDRDGDGWDDRVIARIPLRLPSSGVPVFIHGLRVDPERGLVYMAVGDPEDQPLMIAKVRDCPDPGVDFKEVKKDISLPEDILRQGIEQVIRYGLSGSGIPEGSVAVVAYNEGACLWRGSCGPADTQHLRYRFALLIPESEWDKKDLLINTLTARVKDGTTGDPEKVFLEGSDVYAIYRDIDFVPLKQEEFINADLGLEAGGTDFGLARQTLLLEILLTGTYIDTIEGVKASPVPLDIILSGLASPCGTAECGTEEPSHVWRQEGYEGLKLSLAQFYKDGLLIRFLNESVKGTSLHSDLVKDLREAAGLALRAVLARMISSEEGNRFLSFRADTYGMADTGVLVNENSDPRQWEFTAGVKDFEHWIATMAALSVRENTGVFFPEDIVDNVFEFLSVFNGEKSFDTEDEANAFIAKCFNFIQQELEDISWSVYQAKLIDDPRAAQRNSNMVMVEGAINDFRTNGRKVIIPRFFNEGSGTGLSIPVRMYLFNNGSWEETVNKEIDIKGGTETVFPLYTFRLTGIDQSDPVNSKGWVALTIDLPEKKMRDGDRENNLEEVYYYVLDPAEAAAPGQPLVPVFPDPDGTLFLPEPECACDAPEIDVSLSINGADYAELSPGQCVDLDVTLTQDAGILPM